MKICGIDLAANDAIVVVLDGSRVSWKVINPVLRKVSLLDDEDAGQLRAFQAAVNALVRHHGVNRIVIKKRGKKGKFAGGPISFKMEGVIQLIDTCEVVLLSPQTITAVSKKNLNAVPAELKRYQRDAFFTALTGLDNL
ncbi:MAG: DUF3010 family protein [Dissulfurispiraceae bacterium]|jgi:hypothetical protein